MDGPSGVSWLDRRGDDVIRDYQRIHWTPEAVWLRLAVFSAFTAYALIRAFRQRWERVRFWATFVVVRAVRTFVYVEILRHFPALPLIDFAVLASIEIPVLLTVLFLLNFTREEAESSG